MLSYSTGSLASLVSTTPLRKGLLALRAIMGRGRVTRMSSWNMLPAITCYQCEFGMIVGGTTRGRE
jgi:hypothetical protein